MTCRVCGVLTSSVNIPEKPYDLCVKHWVLDRKNAYRNSVLDRIIDDANRMVDDHAERPEPSFLEADGPMGDPARDMAVGE